MSDEKKEMGELTIFECFKCIGLIIAGCVLFLFIPDDVGILGWFLFAVGTLLFVIGVFRFAAFIHQPESKVGYVIWSASFMLAAIYIQTSGLLYLYNTKGTEKGIIIAALTLCISLGLFIFAFDKKNRKLFMVLIVISRVLCIVLPGIAVYLNVRDDFSDASIQVGTILLIDFVIAGNYAKIPLKSVSGESEK